MVVSFFMRLVVASLVVTGIGMISGCDSGPGGAPQSIATPEQVNNIVEMRKLYDKVGGQWDSLSADEKSQYNKLAGDEAKGQTLWKSMGNPMGSSPSG